MLISKRNTAIMLSEMLSEERRWLYSERPYPNDIFTQYLEEMVTKGDLDGIDAPYAASSESGPSEIERSLA